MSAFDDANTTRRLRNKLSLQIIWHDPTNCSASSYTLIDLITTHLNDTVIYLGNEWLPSFKKHSILNITMNLFAVSLARQSFMCRNCSSICLYELYDLLPCCKWADMSSVEADPEAALSITNSNLKFATDKLAPLRGICHYKNHASWIGPEMR